MIRFKGLMAVVLLFSLYGCSPGPGPDAGARPGRHPAPIEIKAQTDRTTATLADSVVFTLSVRHDPGITIQLPEVGTQIAGLRIEDFGEEGPQEIDRQIELKKWYKLRADIAGTYIIPSLTVGYTSSEGEALEIKTPQIFLEVTSGSADAAAEPLQDILDIKPLEQVRRDWTPFILAGAAGGAALLLLAGVLLFVRLRKKRSLALQKPAHVLALEEFERLQQEQLIEKGIVREHFFRLSDIFRRYFDNRFGLTATEQTTQELLPEIKKLAELPEVVKSIAEQFLVHSDLVKFAKHRPALHEVESSHAQVLSVIEQTREKEPEPPAP